ncbi:unnamed protein product [Bursaphelenchus okinawaensis]|uniref:DUF4440 domain-containing protein n=1 Tax=Bursaphelenchus okinawaensis TaxID=465554 RepID=A0A811KG36_9BILA|nr:unnamed protein product [Bursaphelenchus okinawaensis]CAG9102630.1 unnamed protein product [Bursaphelenchus okinawaensis]
MGLTTAEIDKLIEEIEKRQEEALKNKNPEEFAKTYSENAVLIILDTRVYKGREEIAKASEPFLDYEFTFEKQPAYDVNNGEYIMRKGRYQLAGNPNWFRYMQLHERQPDGSYLTIHDEFEFKK